MGLVIVMAILVGTVRIDGEKMKYNYMLEASKEYKTDLYDTELLLAFVIFCHGDRTGNIEDIEFYPQNRMLGNMIFFDGLDGLTKKGKQRSYYVGKYLRELYDGFISKFYSSTEINVRSTDFDRTKMTALTVLAAMYPPEPEQNWNPNLLWQPIPYSTVPLQDDDVLTSSMYVYVDLLYWINCPKYLHLKQQVYDRPEALQKKHSYQLFFSYLTEKMDRNITTTGDAYYLDNYFQALTNANIQLPNWTQDAMPAIKHLTKMDFAVQFRNTQMIKLASGVMMDFIVNKIDTIYENIEEGIKPKLYLFSGHDTNVAALMAAAKVFEPHQPYYGATFSLQFRRHSESNEFGILAIYARDAGGPGMLLPIRGCGGTMFCPYTKFIELIKHLLLPKEEYYDQCKL